MAIVYLHRRVDTNQPFYVGIGKTTKRAYSKYGRNIFWNKITNVTDYVVEILHEDILWKEACEIEVNLIKKFGRKDLNQGILCNMTDGGDGNVNWTPKLRIEQSKRMKNQIPHNKGILMSQEQKDKISKTRIENNLSKGSNNPMFGKKGILSPHYGKLKPEHSLKLKGKKKPNGFSEKCSINKRGEKHPLSKFTEDDIRYIRSMYKKRDVNFGLKPLSEKYNTSISAISLIINNQRWKHIV